MKAFRSGIITYCCVLFGLALIREWQGNIELANHDFLGVIVGLLALIAVQHHVATNPQP